MSDKERCACVTCGWSWVKGASGAHECAPILLKRLERLERDWLIEHRIIEVLVAAGFVSTSKVEEARNIVSTLP